MVLLTNESYYHRPDARESFPYYNAIYNVSRKFVSHKLAIAGQKAYVVKGNEQADQKEQSTVWIGKRIMRPGIATPAGIRQALEGLNDLITDRGIR